MLTGSSNGSSRESRRGSTCPCGQISGRSRVASWSSRAIARTAGSVGKQPVRVERQREDAVGGGHVPIIRDAGGGGNPPPTAKLQGCMTWRASRHESHPRTRPPGFSPQRGSSRCSAGWLFIVMGETGDDGGTTAAPTTTTTATATHPRSRSHPLPTRIVVTGVGAYDPEGDQSENGGDARLATDGNATTAWKTEHYRTTFSKSGVGLVLDAGRPVKASRVVVTTRDAGLCRPGAGRQLRRPGRSRPSPGPRRPRRARPMH